jgi:hypothetical protein
MDIRVLRFGEHSRAQWLCTEENIEHGHANPGRGKVPAEYCAKFAEPYDRNSPYGISTHDDFLFSNALSNAYCRMVGAFDGISDLNHCEQHLFCTDQLLRTIRVTKMRIHTVPLRFTHPDNLVASMRTIFAPFNRCPKIAWSARKPASPLLTTGFYRPRTIANLLQ